MKDITLAIILALFVLQGGIKEQANGGLVIVDEGGREGGREGGTRGPEPLTSLGF